METYEVYTKLFGYPSITDIIAETDNHVIIPSGMYYVYKKSGSFINISPTPLIQGYWINDLKNPGNKKKSNRMKILTKKYKVIVMLNAYYSESDAKHLLRPVSVIYPGKYYIYMENENGIKNISRINGKPGVWINSNMNRKSSIPNVNDEYKIKKSINGYSTILNAVKGKNPKVRIARGKYKVLKISGDAIYIVKSNDLYGYWVSLSDNNK
jgi:hypothetical protein